MSLTTYSGLSTGVFSRLNRTADATDFDVALELARAEINRRLALFPVRPMHTIATATLTSEYEATPTDILDVDNLAIGDDPLVATMPQNLQAMAEADSTTGQPKYYTQVGTQFRFYPAPDTSYTLTLTYWATVPALTSTATTNWLSLAHPDVYFHGVLAHLYQQYFDEKNAEVHGGLFDAALQKVLDAYPHRQDRAPLKTDISLRWPASGQWVGYNITTDR
jgi:hypothetical protein